MNKNGLIRVGIADDYPVVLRGVEAILSQCTDMELLFAEEDIGQLLAQLKHAPIDVLLCDYSFDKDPLADGLELLRRISRIAPEVKVIFLSAHAAPHIISGALDLGAAGFIGKGKDDFASLPHAIRSAYEGKIYLPPSLSALMLGQMFTHQTDRIGLNMLSERELTVVQMICQGMSIGSVAERLHRSPKTISNQKVAAMKKLGVSNDVELCQAFRDLNG